MYWDYFEITEIIIVGHLPCTDPNISCLPELPGWFLSAVSEVTPEHFWGWPPTSHIMQLTFRVILFFIIEFHGKVKIEVTSLYHCSHKINFNWISALCVNISVKSKKKKEKTVYMCLFAYICNIECMFSKPVHSLMATYAESSCRILKDSATGLAQDNYRLS